MNQNSLTFSRRKLYRMVWSEPVAVLAKKYGVSDVWIAKICKKNNIPRPPRGYWARKQSGQEVEKAPLPKRSNDTTIEINTKPPDTPGNGSVLKRTSNVKHSFKVISVPEILTNPHPLVENSALILESCKPDTTGILVPPRGNCLNIRVSRYSLPRALLIMDTLIKVLAGLDFELLVSKGATRVKIRNIQLGICIGEEFKRRRIKAESHSLDGYYQFGYNLFARVPTPTGKLFLSIDNQEAGQRHKWRDTDSTRLEDCLKSFVSGLIKAADLKEISFPEEKTNTEQSDSNGSRHDTGRDL